MKIQTIFDPEDRANELECELKKQLVQLDQMYKREAQPLVDMLTTLRSMKAPPPMYISLTEAQNQPSTYHHPSDPSKGFPLKMVEAGVEQLMAFDVARDDPMDLAVRIYQAMKRYDD